jgi:hypothetical protein
VIRNYAYNIARLLERSRTIRGGNWMATDSRVANRADAKKSSTERGIQIQAGEREDAADGFESDCRFDIANKTRETVRGS